MHIYVYIYEKKKAKMKEMEREIRSTSVELYEIWFDEVKTRNSEKEWNSRKNAGQVPAGDANYSSDWPIEDRNKLLLN